MPVNLEVVFDSGDPEPLYVSVTAEREERENTETTGTVDVSVVERWPTLEALAQGDRMNDVLQGLANAAFELGRRYQQWQAEASINDRDGSESSEFQRTVDAVLSAPVANPTEDMPAGFYADGNVVRYRSGAFLFSKDPVIEASEEALLSAASIGVNYGEIATAQTVAQVVAHLLNEARAKRRT